MCTSVCVLVCECVRVYGTACVCVCERERETEREIERDGREASLYIPTHTLHTDLHTRTRPSPNIPVRQQEPGLNRPVITAMPVWIRGRYHGGRRPSRDDSFHSPTVIPPSALDKPSIMKRYHRRRTCSHTSPRRSPTMVTLYDTRFVESRWWNDGWTVKTVVTGRSSAPLIPAPGVWCITVPGARRPR